MVDQQRGGIVIREVALTCFKRCPPLVCVLSLLCPNLSGLPAEAIR